jgi:hypothetical protein
MYFGLQAKVGENGGLVWENEMGALRSKEWACNVSRIATTAGEVWRVTEIVGTETRKEKLDQI